MAAHVVLLRFDVPITDQLLAREVNSINWVRISPFLVIMEKNEWLEFKDELQPHIARDVDLGIA